MNRLVVAYAALLPCACFAQTPPVEPRVTAARAADDKELAPLLAKAKQRADAGAGGAALLADQELAPLRELAPFRELVRKHAPIGEVTMVPAGEPGVPLLVRAAVRDQHGKPAPDVLVYAYHTSSKGWYSDRAPHFTGGAGGGDVDHARLFAYVRSDAQGQFVLRTIRPAGYPQSTLPQHIHWHAYVDGKEVGDGEVVFDDDPRLTKKMRDEGGDFFVVCKVEKEGASDVVRPVLDVKLPAPATKK